jgi:hypothetical protein
VTQALLFLVDTACLVVSAVFVVAAARVRGVIPFLLATYLVAWVELVAVLVVLSPPDLVRRGIVATVVAALVPAAIAFWALRGRGGFPAVRPALERGRRALGEPALAAFAVVVAFVFAYLLALALFTPPNSWDAMWVWLARAAFWKQQHGVGYVDDNVVLNAYPPVASIGDLYAMVIARSDRFVGLVALGAYGALVVGVFGIARRTGSDVRAAFVAAFVFATLPVVALQASGALIDLPVAAFLVVCVYFLLGETWADVAFAGVAFALALGAKLTAVVALPVLVVVALVARRGRLRRVVAAAIVAGVAGAWWYWLNLVETGSLNGGLTRHLQQRDYLPTVDEGLVAIVARGLRMLAAFAEVPGARGWWICAYVVAAIVAAACAFAWRRAPGAAASAAAVAIVPLAVLLIAHVLKRGYQWIFFHGGRADLGVIDQDRSVTGASALGSYYGPIGFALLLASIVLVVFAVWRRRVSPAVGALAAAPVVLVATVAVAFSYSSFWGRLFVVAMAFAAAAAGRLVRGRALTWGVVAASAATVFLTLRANDEKPPAVWRLSRAAVQTRVGPGRDNGESTLIRWADTSLPRRAHVALAIEDRDWSYPFFGAHLDRTVRLVAAPGAAPRDVQWLVVAPGRGTAPGAWRRVVATPDGWAAYERRSRP